MPTRSKLLICTLGGSPVPIVTSVRKHRPSYVIFIASEASRPRVSDGFYVLHDPATNSAGQPSDNRLVRENHARVISVEHENPEACIRAIRGQCLPVVEEWRKNKGAVVVDFTGGTKCMSVALGLAARMWRCHFSYVTAAQRDKRGLGQATESGPVVTVFNPWTSLGYEALDQFCLLFNQGYFGAARTIIERHIDKGPQIGQPIVSAPVLLAHGYERWEAFDHNLALRKITAAIDALATGARDNLRWNLATSRAWLESLTQAAAGPTAERAADLIANAERRAREKRFEDGVARLYRACEVIVQCWFKQNWQIADISQFPAGKMPNDLQERFQPRRNKNFYRLTMRDAYHLLQAQAEPLGQIFCRRESGRARPQKHPLGAAIPQGRIEDPESGRARPQNRPLEARNQSILAHGFTPATQETFDHLYHFIGELFTELRRDQGTLSVPDFPKVKAVDFETAL